LTGELTIENTAGTLGADLLVVAGSGSLDLTVATTVDEVEVIGSIDDDAVDASTVDTGTISFDGLAGDDTLTLGVILNTEAATIAFDGGDGTDTLSIANAANLISSTVTLTDVEVIDLVGSATVMADLLDGESYEITGAGFDTSILTVQLENGSDTADLSGLDTSESISSGVALAVLGGAGDDTITGTDSADSITGNAGRDVIDGGAGDDSFVYVLNTELFDANNALVDTIDGGTGTDSIVISAGTPGTPTPFTIGVNDDFGTITSVEQIIATATDQIIDITLHADAVADGIVTVDLSGDTNILGANVIDADAITGTTGMTLTGSAGIDTITGTDNDDVITGGAGADVLTGGRGADTFVFAAGDTGITVLTADTITDFVTTDDTIDFSGVAGTAVNFVAGTTDVLTFAAAVTAANLALGTGVIYAFETDGTDGFLFHDSNADGLADEVILLTGIDETAIVFGDIV
jgi:Ca2+-binding RTX toxin-like protein